MTLLITYFCLALFLSFIFSLLEAVLLSTPTSYSLILKKENEKSGLILDRFKDNINRPLAAILTLNTFAHTIGAAGVGAQVLKIYGEAYVAIASGVLTVLILLFSEIIPKTIGSIYWRVLIGISVRFIQFLIWVTYPFVLLAEFISNFGSDSASVTREEVIAMAEMGEDEGTIEEDESTVIENILKLDNIKAEEVLTPRSVVFALDKDLTVRKALDEHDNLIFSRIPVYSGSIENITGIVRRYDLINSKAEDKFDVTVEELSEPFHTVNTQESVGHILDEFVRRREHLFIVKDEFGQFAGIITLEDAIETLLGVEIVDETDSVVDMRKLAEAKGKVTEK